MLVNMFNYNQKQTYKTKIAPRNMVKKMEESPNGNNEMFAPSFPQTKNRATKGRTHKTVKAVDTSAGGLFSGSLNICLISGLGLSQASVESVVEASAVKMDVGFKN